ncbi:MAG TPA: fluoride efflux transporter CrcB [Vicinamibacterales bacterium]|nr:fluoride efflux transporter CrcB [Vicinamibacterales bacterium]
MIGYLMIAIGGAIGAIARYEVTNLIQHKEHAGFPYGTFVVNMTGCLVIGFTIGLFDERVVTNPNWRLLMVTGFVGAYTTFSTFEAETFNAVSSGDLAMALANVAGSVIAGYFAVWLGFALSRLVPA